MQAFASRFGSSGETAARLLAYVIAGHHAGLADWTAGLDDRLLGTRAPDSKREYFEARDVCANANPKILYLLVVALIAVSGPEVR